MTAAGPSPCPLARAGSARGQNEAMCGGVNRFVRASFRYFASISRFAISLQNLTSISRFVEFVGVTGERCGAQRKTEPDASWV